MNFLKKIVEDKQQFLKEKRAFYATFKSRVDQVKFTPYHLFKRQISQPGKINLIAEIKKASPSKGIIREDFDAVKIAKIYEQQGAAALSVLTEEKYFLGKQLYIRKIRDAEIKLPILIKDFIIDEVQIYEGFANGASAILLIAAILKDNELNHLRKVANHLDMDCLVEVHDERELERVLKLRVDIIGINNRDLETFEVDLKTAKKLIPQIPNDKTIVVESGIQARQEVEFFKNLGAHAVLIGETFMKAKDIGAKVKEVMG